MHYFTTGYCSMVGTPGPYFDALNLTTGSDNFSTSMLTAAQKLRFNDIYGLSGDDIMVVNTRSYIPSNMFGDAGNDTMKVTVTLPQFEYVDFRGGDGNDTLIGSNNDDNLAGNTGADRILGGGGSDNITGGAGYDRLTGGSGSDEFIFDDFEYYSRNDTIYVTGNLGVDHITDFNPKGTLGDKIDIGLGLLYRDFDIRQVGSDVVIKAHRDNIEVNFNSTSAIVDFSVTIILDDTRIADIGRGDFLF
jgi:Ca2+-binding RTX toxin-like protein